MFREIFGNMFSDSSDDYLTAMSMYMFLNKRNKRENNIKVMYRKIQRKRADVFLTK